MSKELSEAHNLKLADLGALVRKIRIKKKISVRRFAASCNVGQETIKEFEKGRRNLQLTTLFKICENLEIDEAYIFGMRNNESKQAVKAMNREIIRGIDPYFTLRERAEKLSSKTVNPE